MFSASVIDGEKVRAQSIHTASQWGLWKRPGQQLCRELESNPGGTARSTGVRCSEQQNQKKRHKEVVKGGGERKSVKMGTKRREGRGGDGCAWEFFQWRNSACYCAHSECMCCSKYADCAEQSEQWLRNLHEEENERIQLMSTNKAPWCLATTVVVM